MRDGGRNGAGVVLKAFDASAWRWRCPCCLAPRRRRRRRRRRRQQFRRSHRYCQIGRVGPQAQRCTSRRPLCIKCPLLSALNSEHSPRSGSRRSREGRKVRFSVNFLQCRGRVQSGIRRVRRWSLHLLFAVFHHLLWCGRGAVNRFRIWYHGTPEISGGENSAGCRSKYRNLHRRRLVCFEQPSWPSMNIRKLAASGVYACKLQQRDQYM